MSKIQGSFKINSGGKVKISSGKLSVEETGLTISMEILQNLPSGFFQGLECKYAIGLDTNVTYDANYLARVDGTVSEDGSTTHNMNNVFIPGAAINDGTIDLYLYANDDLEVGSPVFLGWNDGAESGEAGPTATAVGEYGLRVELKLGSNFDAVETEFDWE